MATSRTLQEALQRARQIAADQTADIALRQEYAQYADWLNELQYRRTMERCQQMRNSGGAGSRAGAHAPGEETLHVLAP